MKTGMLRHVLALAFLALFCAATAAGCASNMSEADKALWNDSPNSATPSGK
jgi:hypothetical protein